MGRRPKSLQYKIAQKVSLEIEHVTEVLEKWPSNPDKRCWVWQGSCTHGDTPVLYHEARQGTVRRLVFEAIAGEKLHETHAIKNICGNKKCINPDENHNVVTTISYMGNWNAAPLPQRLSNSLNIPQEFLDPDHIDMEDVIDLISSSDGLRTPEELFSKWGDDGYTLAEYKQALEIMQERGEL